MTAATVGSVRVVELEEPGGWRVLVPETRRERMRGLRAHSPPGPRVGMLFLGCRSVHTFGMSSPIRVAFLDAELRVVVVLDRPPRRLILPRRGAVHVLESAAGSPLRVGDRLRSRVRAER
ncbi:MAG: DUF192 domain-containing protein [Gemmatimonadota bacterium]